ncbi:hypothetical protein B0T26DRAFT_379639 [Lasiosphaeria miniovina]|uniref:Uncharacterized protein n=1 Tax=Lasiosphaeria miniovina TaxID=1954250 RepID=A0AA40DUQ5_9PEZI|nr:uncharacterized protein B0T26DRAFT_379639 [Lasiosphaeria miniovina]KAK0713901.1 hypothetical protein B0T26DRAFT_379639 [Lasiosphaeria miniovina]
MPIVAHFCTFLALIPLSYGLNVPASFGNVTNTTSITTAAPGPPQDRSLPMDRAIILEPNRMGIPGLSIIPALLSSFFNGRPTTTTVMPTLSSQVLTSGGLQAPSAVPDQTSSGLNSGSPSPAGLGGVLSALNTILSPLTNQPNAAPLSTANPVGTLVSILESVLSVPVADSSLSLSVAEGPTSPLSPVPPTTSLMGSAVPLLPTPPISLPPPLPSLTITLPSVAGNPSILQALTALLPSTPPAASAIAPLVSEVTPLIPLLGTLLPSAMPFLTPLESMLSSQLSAAAPGVGSLAAVIASQVASLTQQVFSSTSVLTTDVPIMSVELPTITIPVPIATTLAPQLSGLTLPTNAPLSVLAATLSTIIGSGNPGLVSSIVGAIVSTLDSMILSGQVNSLISAATVAGGSVLSQVTRE